jgi:hypothetical protein
MFLTDTSSSENRIQALKSKHRTLELQIFEAQKSRATTDFYLRQLKKLKLVVKEEIEGIHHKSANAAGAAG